ncbi:MAG TPA: hypothetical protein VIH41_05925, partial [Myxococcales bacterium]
ANFIVNLGAAKAADVVELIAIARSAVLAKAGVELKPEVRLVGDFDPPLPAELQAHHLKPVLIGREAPPFGMPDPTRCSLRVQA